VTKFAVWLWRRYRAHFVATIVAIGIQSLLFGLVLPSVGFASVYAGLSLRQGVWWAVVAFVLTVVGGVIGWWLCRDALEPVNAWARGDKSDAYATWNAALCMPAVTARAVAKTQAVVHVFVSIPFVTVIAHLDPVEALLLAIGSTTLVMVGGVSFGNGLHALLRPVVKEVESMVPVSARPERRGWNLAGRFNLGFYSLCLVSPIGVTAAVLGTRATMRDYAMTLLASLLLTSYFLLVFNVGLVGPTVSAVKDLLGAVSRVHQGDFDKRVPITSIDEFGDLAVAFNQLQEAMRERESLRAAFGSYVDETLAQRLLAQGNSVFEGEEVEVSVFFADVRGFTGYVEAASPHDAVARLNKLFEILVPVIQANGGHANHYLGDGLLAVFGTPSSLTDHADKAVAAAIEIQRQVRVAFQGDLRLGIGINTGLVTAGTIGGGGRLEFTVIGDTVNVASRVERMTKETGDSILITQATAEAMRTRPCRTMSRGDIELRGKTATVCVHALVPTEF
jgi:class 3 adenylate cyclase